MRCLGWHLPPLIKCEVRSLHYKKLVTENFRILLCSIQITPCILWVSISGTTKVVPEVFWVPLWLWSRRCRHRRTLWSNWSCCSRLSSRCRSSWDRMRSICILELLSNLLSLSRYATLRNWIRSVFSKEFASIVS